MRVLRILTSDTLACGCFVGVYELYNGETIALVDAAADTCASHRAGQPVDLTAMAELEPEEQSQPSAKL